MLKKSTIAILSIMMLSFGTGTSLAQQTSEETISVVDPATGRVIEAPKLFSEMSEEEKAIYTEEDLKLLEAHEIELKRMEGVPAE